MDINRLEKVWQAWLEKEDYRADIDMRKGNRKEFYRLIMRHFKNKARVLEVGCGTALDSNLLAGAFQNIKFYATDISANSLLLADRIARQSGNKLHLVRGDINKLYFKAETFDIVFSQGVIEHFPDVKSILREQVRLLKPKGVLIISVPQKYTVYTLRKYLRLHKKTWEWEWETEYSYGELKRLGQACGLQKIEAAGYQYWRSWWEPAWVLRDLYDKFQRRNPLRDKAIFLIFKKYYDSLWDFLEQRWGIYFMQNIAMVFVAPNSDRV